MSTACSRSTHPLTAEVPRFIPNVQNDGFLSVEVRNISEKRYSFFNLALFLHPQLPV